MKKSILILSLCVVAFAFSSEKKPDPKKNLDIARAHMENRLKNYFDTLRFPRTMNADTLVAVDSRDWTSGFYSGVLWQMYDYTKDKKWEQAARKWTSGLEKEKYNTNTHDLGFMLYCSFGNGLHLRHHFLAPSGGYNPQTRRYCPGLKTGAEFGNQTFNYRRLVRG